ncbi:hypothetical protein N0V90_007620 [Kalmusia sp. IMI 367209]|nr:hypothetical protein N0V90_007620 [Kalmusia sp. IMI 367209]
MWLNLSTIFTRLSHDPSIRSIVITGAGDRAFTAGLDVQAASQGVFAQSSSDAARTATILRRHIYEFQACVSALEKCEKPVIAVLHGISYGLALDLSLASVGNYSWVKDVCLSARIFGSDEALRVGLVSAVYADKSEAVGEALKLATLIASKSPVAVQGTKE